MGTDYYIKCDKCNKVECNSPFRRCHIDAVRRAIQAYPFLIMAGAFNWEFDQACVCGYIRMPVSFLSEHHDCQSFSIIDQYLTEHYPCPMMQVSQEVEFPNMIEGEKPTAIVTIEVEPHGDWKDKPPVIYGENDNGKEGLPGNSGGHA